jgi:hypothetical protein
MVEQIAERLRRCGPRVWSFQVRNPSNVILREYHLGVEGGKQKENMMSVMHGHDDNVLMAQTPG